MPDSAGMVCWFGSEASGNTIQLSQTNNHTRLFAGSSRSRRPLCHGKPSGPRLSAAYFVSEESNSRRSSGLSCRQLPAISSGIGPGCHLSTFHGGDAANDFSIVLLIFSKSVPPARETRFGGLP